MGSGIYSHHTGYHNRHSLRLPGYDYSKQGYYFVTVCIHDRKDHFLGDITNCSMILNDFGRIVQNEIIKTEKMRPNIKIDEYIIMPNHWHVIYQICDNDIRRGTLQRAPTTPFLQYSKFPVKSNHQPQIEQFGKPTSNSIPTIVRLTKSTITKQINIMRNLPGTKVWQRNYYEHIIRNNESLYHIKQYIQNNPMYWEDNYENHITHEIDTFEMVEIEEF